jgi:hypothetical protein
VPAHDARDILRLERSTNLFGINVWQVIWRWDLQIWPLITIKNASNHLALRLLTTFKLSSGAEKDRKHIATLSIPCKTSKISSRVFMPVIGGLLHNRYTCMETRHSSPAPPLPWHASISTLEYPKIGSFPGCLASNEIDPRAILVFHPPGTRQHDPIVLVKERNMKGARYVRCHGA